MIGSLFSTLCIAYPGEIIYFFCYTSQCGGCANRNSGMYCLSYGWILLSSRSEVAGRCRSLLCPSHSGVLPSRCYGHYPRCGHASRSHSLIDGPDINILPLVIIFNEARLFAVSTMAIFHLGIWFLMGFTSFALMMIACHLLFINDHIMRLWARSRCWRFNRRLKVEPTAMGG